MFYIVHMEDDDLSAISLRSLRRVVFRIAIQLKSTQPLLYIRRVGEIEALPQTNNQHAWEIFLRFWVFIQRLPFVGARNTPLRHGQQAQSTRYVPVRTNILTDVFEDLRTTRRSCVMV